MDIGCHRIKESPICGYRVGTHTNHTRETSQRTPDMFPKASERFTLEEAAELAEL